MIEMPRLSQIPQLEAIQVRLRYLEGVVSELRKLASPDSTASRRSLRDIWAAERGLYLGTDVVFDIGNHILSAQCETGAENYADIIEQLSRQGILDERLHRRLRGLAGFRNILVHDDLRLDPDRVEEALDKAPEDFDNFARAVRRWLEGRIA